MLSLLCSTALSGHAAAQVTAAQDNIVEDNRTVFDDITVEGRYVGGYRQDTTRSALRIIQNVEDLPLSVSIIPSEVLNDQVAQSLADAYRNVSSVSREATGDFTSNRETAFIRGFQAQDVNRNGFPIRAVGALDLAGIESVDVLKGPASFAYGQVEPGGLINYTTKRPLNRFFAAAQGFVGSFDHYRGTLDITGPLDKDATILARVVGAYTDEGSYRDFVNSDKYYLSGVLTFQPTDALQINIEASQSELNDLWDAGVPFSVDGEPIARIRNYYGEPELDGINIKDTFIGADTSWNISESLTFRGSLSYHKFTNDYEAMRHVSVFEADDGEQRLNRRLTLQNIEATEKQAVGILTWKVNTGGMEHNISTMFDYRKIKVNNFRQRDDRSTDLSISVLNPAYGLDFDNITLNTDCMCVTDSKELGIAINDQIKMFDDRLHLLLGLRYDEIKASTVLDLGSSVFAVPNARYDNWSFTGGILFEALDNVSIYANYAQSFNARESFYYYDEQGDLLPPKKGEQFEVGLRANLLNESLRINFAAFEITRQNEPFYFYDETTESYFYDAIGETRSRGFEVDVVGRLTRDLSIIASFSHLDAEVVETADYLVPGTRLRNIPKYSGSAWLSYKRPLKLGGNEGELGLGAGVFYTGKRAGDPFESFYLPSYTQVDASISYNMKFSNGRGLLFRLNASNLFNETIYQASNFSSNVQTGAPRRIIGSIGIRF